MSTGVTTYHHGNLRATLVDAAVAAARVGGPEALVLRTLAREAGVSHNAAYRHFADRAALVDEVAQVGLVELVAAMQRRCQAVDTAAGSGAPGVRRARLRLRAVGRGYVDFALAEPGLFRAVFTAYPEIPADHADSDPDPFAMLNAALDDLVEVGYLAAELRPGAEFLCWSAVHGFSVLCTEGPLRTLPAQARDVAVEQVLDTIDRGFGASAVELDLE